jgi:hypothetical protein
MKILIPLGTGSNWDNNELRYCLRSLDENLKGDYEIHIYGNEVPYWLTNVTVHPIERYYPERIRELNYGKLNYENFFDTLNKVKTFASKNKGHFVYMYDDVLLLHELYIGDILNVPLELEDKSFYHIRNFDKHGRTINSAIDLLQEDGGFDPLYNFETHLPRIYECARMIFLFEMFSFEELSIPYAIATMYFNYWSKQPDTLVVNLSIKTDIKDIKAGFYFDPGKVASYMSNSLEEIEKAVQGKTWVNYNDMGLNLMATDLSGKQYLKEWIMNRFPNKSKYEI